MSNTKKSYLPLILAAVGTFLVAIGIISPLIGYELPSLQIEPRSWILCEVYVSFENGIAVEGALVQFIDYPYPTAKYTDNYGFCSEIMFDLANGDVYATVRVTYGSYDVEQGVSGVPDSTVQVYFYDVPIEEPPLSYVCDVCEAEFATQSELDAHIADVHQLPSLNEFLNVATLSGILLICLATVVTKVSKL